MPFKCELTLGNSFEAGEPVEFVSWVEEVWNADSKWGHVVPQGTPYIIARKNGIIGKVFTTFRGVLMEQGKLSSGDMIKSETILAIMAAEGDEIAYGKPYSILKQDT